MGKIKNNANFLIKTKNSLQKSIYEQSDIIQRHTQFFSKKETKKKSINKFPLSQKEKKPIDIIIILYLDNDIKTQ